MASLHNHFLGVGSISRLFPGFIQGGADLKDTALRILQSKILAILGDSGVLLPPDIGVYDPHLIGVGWSFYRPLQGPQEGKGRGGGSAWLEAGRTDTLYLLPGSWNLRIPFIPFVITGVGQSYINVRVFT